MTKIKIIKRKDGKYDIIIPNGEIIDLLPSEVLDALPEDFDEEESMPLNEGIRLFNITTVEEK